MFFSSGNTKNVRRIAEKITDPATASATEAKQDALIAAIGDQGTAPPALPTGSSGVLGWLRNLWVRLGSLLPQSASGALLIGNSRAKIRDEFPGPSLNAELWDLIVTGNGHNITLGNGITGSYLLLASGTNPNTETIIRSKGIFSLPVRLAAFVTASQRIANTELFVELIEVDADGNPVTVAASQPNAGTSRNHAAIKFDGTTATQARLSARSGGAPEFQGGLVTTQTTVATGTGPNFFPVGMFEMQASGEHVVLIQVPIDTTAAATVASRITQAAPNPDTFYKLQIRLRNLGTAPASSTDYRIHAIRLFDFTRHTVEIIGGPGHSSAGMGVPVTLTGSPTGTAAPQIQGTAPGGQAAVGNPLRTGGVSRTAQPSARTDGQMSDALMDKVGRLILQLNQIRDLRVPAPMVTLTGTTETTIVAAVASTFNDLEYLHVASTATFSGSPTAARLDFRSTTGGTVLFSLAIPLTPGASIQPFDPPAPWPAAAVNTNWTAQLVLIGGTSPAVASGDIRITPIVVRNI